MISMSICGQFWTVRFRGRGLVHGSVGSRSCRLAMVCSSLPGWLWRANVSPPTPWKAASWRAVAAARESGLPERVMKIVAAARRYAEGTAVRIQVRRT
jgi:hypothetical protein